MTLFLPQADTLPVAWPWFQGLLSLTLPLHLLAMNSMLACLTLGLFLLLRGRENDFWLAHRTALALPITIALTVNLGVAPLLFLQVLYGQFIYTSSILMASFWLAVIPLLIAAYALAYFYDFRFSRLGQARILVGGLSLLSLLGIAFLFSSNMTLMALPELFPLYLQHPQGDLLVADRPDFWPRLSHMVLGGLAVGSLFVALLGQWRSDRQQADDARRFGLQAFAWLTGGNLLVGLWYLLNLESKALFMGGRLLPTCILWLAVVVALGALWSALRHKLWSTVGHAMAVVVLMSIARGLLRDHELAGIYLPEQFSVTADASPMLFFFVCLLLGLLAMAWLAKVSMARGETEAGSQ